MSALQPGPLGSTSSPFSITGVAVTNPPRHGALARSISMMQTLGTAAEKCALMKVLRWP
jgi:hypothetical protein